MGCGFNENEAKAAVTLQTKDMKTTSVKFTTFTPSRDRNMKHINSTWYLGRGVPEWVWCSWVLMSAQSPMAPWSWLLFSSHECSLLYGAKLMSVYGCSWVFNSNQEHSWLLLAVHECSRGLLGAQECSWLLISSTHEKPWVWCHGARSTHKALSAHQHSWVLIAPYTRVLLGAHEHTSAPMRATERSQQVMTATCFIK